jgi:hypothetical protein
MRRAFSRLDPYLLLLMGLSLFALAPLTAPGYFYSAHDGRHSVFFITMFDEAIRSGALWPRWGMHHNMGYGYPTFLVQAPLAFYVAELFVLVGVGVTNAAKLTWVVTILMGAWGMYALVKRWCGSGNLSGKEEPLTTHKYALKNGISIPSLCGVVAGLLYTYAPYHLLDIYVRAALAETLLIAWLPWVILAFDRLVAYGRSRGWQGRLLVAALSYAGALLTHAFALPAFTPLLAAFILFRLWLTWRVEVQEKSSLQWRTLTYRTLLCVSAGIAGLLLAAIFLLPLVIEGQFLVQENWTRETYSYERHWVYGGQFFSPFWGYGYSDDPVGAKDGMGFQQGAILLLLAFFATYLILQGSLFVNRTGVGETTASTDDQTAEQEALQLLMLFFLIATAAILLATTPIAAGVWRSLPLLEIIQFPWRLLAPAAFTLSALGGLAVWQLLDGMGLVRMISRQIPRQFESDSRSNLMEEAGILTLIVVIVFASFGYSQPSEVQPIEAWREDGRAVAEFEAEHPDMYGYTQYNEMPYSLSPMQAQYLAALEAGVEEDAPLDRQTLTRLVISAGEGVVSGSYSLGHAFGGNVEMASAGTVQIQLLAFPGWQVRIDGSIVDYRISPPYGLMEIDVPAGSHLIDVWMGLTPVRLAGALTSGLTLLLLVGLWLVGDFRTRRSIGRD